MVSITLTIESDLENVSLVGISINALAQHFGMSESCADDVEICVVEGINNVIEHAYIHDPGKTVAIIVESNSTNLYIKIKDSGISMGKLTEPEIDVDLENINTLPEGGFGLYIIHNLMDSVQYGSVDGTNTLSMTKRIDSTTKS
ncbi:ATP-binding protein [Desulfosediminicola flagellatus]|uniref:ATP-binding protein n=1 Tax=Desulfosediminicola flagellatus TaxID=2569541 RepID=UPI0010ABBDC6|nr:ATP-binding protein [Desulfosediminicola flagellatus]